MFAFKKKMLWLILICTFLTALIVGSVSLVMSIHKVQHDSDRELELRCERTALEVDSILGNIRRSVELGHRQMSDFIYENPQVIDDRNQLLDLTARLEDRIISQAQYTPGCVAVYVRYDLTLPVDGFFYTRDRRGALEKHEMTPMENYDPSDIEHVGWYYEPVRVGHGIWMAPYNNLNIKKHLISYVIPVYYEMRTVGVVGMDIDFAYISDFVMRLKAYETGYAFATYGDQFVIHRNFDFYTPISDIPELGELSEMLKNPPEERTTLGKYKYHGNVKRYARKTLESDIDLFLCAPESEIYSDTNDLMRRLIVVIMCSVVVVLLIMNGMLNRFIRLATRDALTKLPNRERFTTFFDNVSQTIRKSSSGDKKSDDKKDNVIKYGFFLMDIDKFKRINDTFGHDQGDRVLCRVADALRKIDAGGMVSRWGGDEFVGLLPIDEISGRLRTLCREIDEVDDEVYGKISISIGVCKYDGSLSLIDLTRLADDGMYKSKQHPGSHVTWV